MKKILIVDDEKSVREMIAFVLRDGEYEVVFAANGREALR